MKIIFYYKYLLILLLFTIINSILAVDSLPAIRNWNSNEDKIKVKISRDNIFQERLDNHELLQATPKRCLAASIADLKHKITWQPKWYYSGAGTVRIPAARISLDHSVLAIIENIGNPNAPSSSRIILINCYNFKILRIIELPEQLLDKLCYIPNSNKLIATVVSQPTLKQSFGLMVIDLTGKKIPYKIDTADKIISMTASTKKLFIVFEAGNINYFDLAALSAPSRQIRLLKNINALVFHSATNRLIAAGLGKLNYLNLSTMATDIYAETELPSNFVPNEIVTIDRKGSCVLLAVNSQLVLAENRQARQLGLRPGAALAVNSANNMFAVSLQRKQVLQLYQLPALVKLKSCEPQKLKEKTGGDIIMLAFLPQPFKVQNVEAKILVKPKKKRVKKVKTRVKKLIVPAIYLVVIDSHGNIYKLKYYKKRWSKMLLIKAKK
jgi:hypothetical protein